MRAGIGSFNSLNLLLPKWFVRLWAYQLRLWPASECTYGGKSTFLLHHSNNKPCRFLFFFSLPAQIRSEPKGLVFVSVQLLPRGRGGGRIPRIPLVLSIWSQTGGENMLQGKVQVQHAGVSQEMACVFGSH